MTTEPATITVAIPTFNRRALLERAVASALAETSVPVRVSVSDNASTDDTEDYMTALAARDPRVSYTRNASNLGGLRNIANVLAAVRTAYFVPLADDDMLLPGFLRGAYPIMESHPELGATVFATEARTLDDGLVHIYPDYIALAPSGPISAADHLRLWLRHGHCAWSSVLWRTRVMERVGVPYSGIGLPGDVDFQARVFAAFPAFLVNEPGAIYRVHDAQASLAYDMTHLPDWAAVFANLDRSAAALEREGPAGGLTWDEYLDLRQTAWNRLHFVWKRPSEAVLTAAQRRRLALIAGFRLGDWPLAMSLAEAEDTGATPARRLFSLPGPDAVQSGRLVQGGPRDLLLATIRAFADGAGRERDAASRLAAVHDAGAGLEARVDAAETARQDAAAAVGRLEREIAERQAREAALLSQIEALQQRCEREESRYVSRRTRQLLARWTRWRPPSPTPRTDSPQP